MNHLQENFPPAVRTYAVVVRASAGQSAAAVKALENLQRDAVRTASSYDAR